MREVYKKLRYRCWLASDDVRTEYGGKAKYAEATKAFKEQRERWSTKIKNGLSYLIERIKKLADISLFLVEQ